MSVAGALIDPAGLIRATLALVADRDNAMAWMLVYPLWVARRHARLPRLPYPHTIVVEALSALLATAVVMVDNSMVFWVMIDLFGDRAMPTMPLKPIAGSRYWYDPLGLLILACVGGTIGQGGLFPRHAVQHAATATPRGDRGPIAGGYLSPWPIRSV